MGRAQEVSNCVVHIALVAFLWPSEAFLIALFRNPYPYSILDLGRKSKFRAAGVPSALSETKTEAEWSAPVFLRIAIVSTFHGGVVGFVYPVSGIKTTVGASTAAGSATGVGVKTGLGPGGPGGEREGIGKGETIVGVGGGDV